MPLEITEYPLNPEVEDHPPVAKIMTFGSQPEIINEGEEE